MSPSTTALTRVIWIDYAGLLRTKCVPSNLLTNNLRVTRCGMILTIWGGIPPVSTEGCVGEVTMIAPKHGKIREYISNLRRTQIPWHPSHEFVFADMYDESNRPWLHCPRGTLQRAVNLLNEHGLQMQAGFELEFTLQKPTIDNDGETMRPYPDLGTMVYASAQMLDIASDIIDQIIVALRNMGIVVIQVHAENGTGQFEVVLQHRPVQRAVEDVILAREAIRFVAREHELHATFAPVWGSGVGNGGHVHISLDGHFGTEDTMSSALTNSSVNDNKGANNENVWIGMDETAQHFVAGIVEGLPWVMFAVNASPISYQRLKPNAWVGVYKVWGINNKETPLRMAEDRTNIEIKVGDGISNPFLAMAAIITAGVIGVRESTSLLPPCQSNPHCVASEMGYERLPESVDIAMKNFQDACKDDFIGTVFPPEVVQDFVAVRQEETRYAKEKGTEALQKLVMKLF